MFNFFKKNRNKSKTSLFYEYEYHYTDDYFKNMLNIDKIKATDFNDFTTKLAKNII